MQVPATKPLLESLRDLEHRLGVRRTEIAELLKSPRLLYHSFSIPKRQHPYPGAKRQLAHLAPKKTRPIDNPAKQLKDIQRRILKRILGEVELPPYVRGAVKGSTTTAHAAQHLANQGSTLIRMDIRSFYSNITNQHVYYVWRNLLLCPPRIASILTKLTTFERHLPQGAPTSPAIANILLVSVIGPICAAANAKDVTITTWIDDIVISGVSAREFMEPVRAALASQGFKIAPEKREISGSSKEKSVTGARLGQTRTRAPHKAIAELRAAIHRLEIGAVPPPEMEAYRRNLAGRLAYLFFLDPKDGAMLQRQAEKVGIRLN